MQSKKLVLGMAAAPMVTSVPASAAVRNLFIAATDGFRLFRVIRANQFDKML